jgi:hypothetical protein
MKEEPKGHIKLKIKIGWGPTISENTKQKYFWT